VGRRNNILDNLVSEIEKIKKGDVVQKFVADNSGSADYTYKTTPRLVDKDFELWTAVHAFPAVFVSSGDATLEGKPSRPYREAWEVILTLYVKNNSDIELELSDLIEDVMIAINQDITRGGCAIATFVTRIDTETRLQKGYGLAEIGVTILYHYGV
jgi:hypothetical protein